MKEIKPGEWIDISLDYLKIWIKSSPENISVNYINGYINRLTLNQYKSTSRYTYNKWQDRLQLNFKPGWLKYKQNNKIIPIKKIYREILKNKQLITQILVCVKVKDLKRKMLIKFFDKYYYTNEDFATVAFWKMMEEPKQKAGVEWIALLDNEHNTAVELKEISKLEVALNGL